MAIVTLGAVLALSMMPLFADAGVPMIGVRAPGGSNLGDGFYTLTSTQTVTANAYWDNFNCPSQAQFRWCVAPVGVSYIPPANVVIISEGNCGSVPGCNGTQNSLGELVGTNTSLMAPLLSLSCFPGIPYYPGTGDDYYVPCTNESFGWRTILSVDYQTDTLVANISDPAGANPLTYDPSNGMIYGGEGSEISAIDPSAGTTEATVHVTNASFVPGDGIGGAWYSLVYDPATNSLILPSNGNRLLSVDPSNGTAEASVLLPGAVQALAVDSATDQLFVSTVSADESAANASALSIFDATTFSLEARLTIPSCVENICTVPDPVSQILLDPTHGDAYLVGQTALFGLNLSTLSLVGSIEDYGDGEQESSTFISAADAIVGTYIPFMVGPGFLLLLQHGIVTTWTSFLWLPPVLGELTLVLVAVAAAAFVVYRIWATRRNRRRSSLPPQTASPP